MKAWRWALGTLAAGSLAAGCGGGSPAPPAANKVALGEQPVAAQAAPQKSPAPTVMPKTPEPGPPLPPLAYEARGRRDPFAPVQLATEKTGLEVGTVKLVGIISGITPLALAETPDGLGYILKQGDVLGNGRVTEVTASSVTFAISGRAAQRETSLTLRIGRD
jgi:hypothetical protein